MSILRWKIYRDGGDVATCAYAEEAAAFIAACGGGEIRDGHFDDHVVWREGHEAFSAGDSSGRQRVAKLVHERAQAHIVKNGLLNESAAERRARNPYAGLPLRDLYETGEESTEPLAFILGHRLGDAVARLADIVDPIPGLQKRCIAGSRQWLIKHGYLEGDQK